MNNKYNLKRIAIPVAMALGAWLMMPACQSDKPLMEELEQHASAADAKKGGGHGGGGGGHHGGGHGGGGHHGGGHGGGGCGGGGGSTMECVDFESFTAGQTVASIFGSGGSGPILVNGGNPDFPATNAAMAFDSDNPTGGDPDLGTPNAAFGGPGIGTGGVSGTYVNDVPHGMVLILSEDLDATDPDDADVWGATLSFDFSSLGSVRADNMTIIDVDGESSSAYVRLYDASMTELATFPLPETGDNGVASIDLLGTTGVVYLDVRLNGSGAVADLCFEADGPPPSSCTRTIGYWKNHTGFGPQADEVSALLPIQLGSASGSETLDVTTAGMARNVLKQNVYGSPSNGITKLYAQLLAAKLNMAAGADGTDVAATVSVADAFLAAHDHDDWSSLSSAQRSDVNGWKDILDDYNNGVIGPGHCN